MSSTFGFVKDSALMLAQAQAKFMSVGGENSSLEGASFVQMPLGTASTVIQAGIEPVKSTIVKNIWERATFTNTVLTLAAFLLLRAAVIIVYRLYFHPLSRFPGPKIAAVSRLYEFYYQGLQLTEFPRVIREMHKKYGPIVRISPEELSVDDSDFNMDFFMKDKNLNKDTWYYGFGYSNSLFVLLDQKKHKERQGHVAHHMGGKYFAANAHPLITREVKDLLKNFEESTSAEKPLNVSLAYRRTGNEILRTFLLGDAGNTSGSKDYAKDAKLAYHPLFRGITFIRHFKWLFEFNKWSPNWLLERGLPMAKFAREAESNIRKLVSDYDLGIEGDEALVYRLIDSDPSYKDNGAAAAVEEFMELLWGGREVLAHAMTNITYHLMNKPETMEKLRAELKDAKFDLATATQQQLSTLPYLYGVCKEGIRLQLGGGFRIPRVSTVPVVYKDYVIPAETPISMCPNFFHQDENIFHDATEFIPERWSEPGVEKLEHFWRPFGNGSRGCAGRNMALEVVFRTTANIFNNYKVDFHGITPEYCQNEGMLKVFPQHDSTGLVVSVEKCESS